VIAIGAVKSHLERVPGPSKTPEALANDPDAVGLELSRRRNPIERALRHIISEGLQFAYGIDRAAHQALQCLSPERRIELARYSYEDRWEHTYFDELVRVVDKEWPAFQNFFSTDKAKVLAWLDHVNRSRADAHARNLKPDDLAFVRVSFTRLEEALGLVD
jgi:hypothetical protein